MVETGTSMDRIRIVGGQSLTGTIPISGAKNAALPLMIASLLTRETLTLQNVPGLADVRMLVRILGHHGVDYSQNGRRVGEDPSAARAIHLCAREIVDTTAPYELVSRMRASFWVIAPLLARMGEARVSLPGGCAIGTRPVDLLLMALEKLGAEIEIEAGYAHAKAPRGLTGADIHFDKVTVGGTHTALMAAVLAKGHTRITNAAREPEVGDLASCLVKMGARISGAGSSTIEIEGVGSLSGTTHRVLPDRIEAGTYAMAAAMAGGDVLLEGAEPDLLESALDAISRAGASVSITNEGIRVKRNGSGLTPVDIATRAVSRLPDRPAGPVHGDDDDGQGLLAHHRDDLREPLHARAGARASRRADQARRRRRHGRRRAGPAGRAGHGDRPARLGLAGDRRPGRRRRDDGQPRLPSRQGLRAPGTEARAVRRHRREALKSRLNMFGAHAFADQSRQGPA